MNGVLRGESTVDGRNSFAPAREAAAGEPVCVTVTIIPDRGPIVPYSCDRLLLSRGPAAFSATGLEAVQAALDGEDRSG